MFWLFGILIVFVMAYVIIKLTLDTKKNPDSNLGILDHPSVYKKQEIEMVDKPYSNLKESEDSKNKIV